MFQREVGDNWAVVASFAGKKGDAVTRVIGFTGGKRETVKRGPKGVVDVGEEELCTFFL